MKSYTDIEQSKKLAEILPIESADMFYLKRVYPNGELKETEHALHNEYITDSSLCLHSDINKTPCWSLAALIEQLPNDLVIKGCSAVLWMGKKQVCYYRRDDDTSVFEYLSKGDNLLDAIVEMIKMLKSRNLL